MQLGDNTPAWSGVFWEGDDGRGFMTVAWGDLRPVTYPAGRELEAIQESDEGLTFVYRKAL